MKRTQKIGIAVAVVVAAALGCYVFVSTRGAKPAPEPEKGNPSALLTQKGALTNAVKSVDELRSRLSAVRSVTNKAGRVVQVVSKGRLGANGDNVFRDEDGKAYPEKEQVLMRQALAVVENDDLDAARELAEKAAGSGNAELRGMVVDALSWFGQNALVELTEYMSDPDEGVAEEARSSWMRALQEIEDDGLKAGVVELTLNKLKNKDVLEDVANELVGMDELAAVQVLANVIVDSENTKAVSAAKEAYNSITGDDWSSVDAAEAWLQENYTPPEPDSPSSASPEKAK